MFRRYTYLSRCTNINIVSRIFGNIRKCLRRLSRYIRRRDNEEVYLGFNTTTVTSGGGTINIHLENRTSDRVIDVHDLIITSQFEGQFAIYDRFESVSGGSNIIIENLYMDEGNGGPDSGNMSMASDVSFTDTGTHFREAIPSGGPGGSMGGTGIETEPLIDPGRQIVVELQNDTANAGLGTVAVIYSERPQSNEEF